ncbi:hypothetical protein CROQUDRAFT_672265 [Cronartium quercuum f. sp. fusiforme G11]|uniref:HSF-type DNA-binding domain-containing protein n=1 Tax=Cronartium quercuum f. sp. fusiforme G11 TaxID=708437 RepID=A0A9P6T9W7_9BASI|nr:hypothetical protein CROQUDRAFT_672265 [Cronartium quercuum f. sp. fusiforme G11]
MPSVPSNGGIPFISKTHQHHVNARRTTPMASGTELVPISNRSRIDSVSGSSRSFPPTQVKSDVTEMIDGVHHLQMGSDGNEVETSPPTTCTAFISKLYHLCSHDDYRAFIRWTAPGDAFILAHANTDFATIVLPKFFRHSNVSSFIRQLNLYNFTRIPVIKLLDTIDNTSNTSPACAFSGFSHPSFRRDDQLSLRFIKPKPSKSKAARKAVKSAGSVEDKTNKTLRRNPPSKSKI